MKTYTITFQERGKDPVDITEIGSLNIPRIGELVRFKMESIPCPDPEITYRVDEIVRSFNFKTGNQEITIYCSRSWEKWS